MEAELKYKELTGEILKAAFAVHNGLGCGFLEKVYENALCLELRLEDIKVEMEKRVVIKYRGSVVGEYISDIVVEDKVIVELKNVDEIASIHKAQLLNYLRASGIKVGLIINFAKPKLEFQRFVV